MLPDYCFIAIAREGYQWAEANGDKWFPAVNMCPYGQAIVDRASSDPRAFAWYYGFWFWQRVIKPWRKACGNTHKDI